MGLKDNKREAIHSRLKKSAARLWDYQDTDTEGFDPVVDLLFGACAYEFERLSTDINISQSRILEKVAQILLPEVFVHPAPSYTILHAKPALPDRLTDPADQFVFDKDFIDKSNKVQHKKVFFSPTSRFRLVDADVAVMATTQEIFQIRDLVLKETILESNAQRIPVTNTIWIGLKTNPAITTLKDVSFYFDWLNTPGKEDLLKLLHLAVLSCDGKRISTKGGFSSDIDNTYKSETTDILGFLDINLKTEKKVNSLFEPHFITVAGDVMPLKRKYPPEFTDYYLPADLDKMKEDLCWIRIDLPEVFPVEFLKATLCTPDAFPVMNRKLHSSNRPFTLNEDLNILPMITDDHFFSVCNILSSNHINYQQVPFKRLSDFATGTYAVRTEGVKRFDERNASDYVQYLIELLREEHVAFRSLGSSLIEKELNDLQIIINRLSLNLARSKDLKENAHFVIIKSEMAEDVWLEFWSTTGVFGNNIQFGSNFLNNDFDKKDLKTLTVSAGGKNPPNQIERIYLFKNELLTRNRVVTNEDIRVVCFTELGSDLEDVDIAPGCMISPEANKGFQTCINVKLKLREGISDIEKDNAARMIGNSLKHKSSCIYRYKVEYV